MAPCLTYSLIIYFAFIIVMAVASIANIVKSSLGPVGLDKMLVDDIGVSLFVQIFFYILMNLMVHAM